MCVVYTGSASFQVTQDCVHHKQNQKPPKREYNLRYLAFVFGLCTLDLRLLENIVSDLLLGAR